MKSVLAASAVMALAGSSYGFTLLTIGQNAGDAISASSGSIVVTEVYDSSTYQFKPQWSAGQLLVVGTNTAWSGNRAAIDASSWFGIDSFGPGNYQGGTSAANRRPQWNDNLGPNNTAGLRIGNVVLSGGGDGNNLVSAITTDQAGWGFGPQFAAPPSVGAPSTLNSLSGDALVDSVESVFIGHFTLSDPQASLAGTLAISVAGVGPADGFQLNFNGEANLGFALAQVRRGASIDVYVVEIPAPGALAAFGLAGLAGIRRRR